MEPASLDHCVIHVSDWDRANAFYLDVFGAELIDRGSGRWALEPMAPERASTSAILTEASWSSSRTSRNS
jgi:catechol 2,3-dioxygenase-like lactoylglutathione lyase family enzyme